MIIRKYEEKDISKMIEIWNEVVEDGIRGWNSVSSGRSA